MPLIILTGHPSSGKTHRANQIQAHFEARISNSSDSSTTRKVLAIPSHHASLDPKSLDSAQNITVEQCSNLRDQLYNHSSAEKVARAEEFSAIKRALNKNDIVIADGLNYIKGFRYQLWCEAKAAATRCVVVHVAAREDECEEWNRQRIQAWGWEFPEQEEETHTGEQMRVGGVNVRVGRNVLGELEPESHTAIYGDKVVAVSEPRSRSSSMGGGVSDGDAEENEPDASSRRLHEDTMTLKSLYISDTKQLDRPSPNKRVQTTQQPPPPPSQDPPALIEIDPPHAKSALPYAPATLKSLLMRYEPPSPFTRWDTPLFTIPTTDVHPPYESIWAAIFPSPNAPSKKALSQLPGNGTATTTLPDHVRPHAATILPQATASDALQVLESSTADVVKSLLDTARQSHQASGEGGELVFTVGQAGTSAPRDQGIQVSVCLPLNVPLSQPLLQRLRRKYTQIQRGSIAHGRGHVSGREEVVRGFVAFLDAEWGGA